VTWVGVAGFEPAASSSRRQRDRCMASANTAWTRWLPSAEVRQCPSKSGAIVAQFVTQADDHVQRAVRFSGGLASPRRSITDRLTGLYAVLATQGVRVHLLVSRAVVSAALAACRSLQLVPRPVMQHSLHET
jgi:hypothetical protein